mmetsp:Transcript_3410/g.10540  ORF Transcript_3410/g.10540 Transcript_3410/m.10540 type:complete len:89 (+) Transcript_3410:2456-2722(+)
MRQFDVPSLPDHIFVIHEKALAFDKVQTVLMIKQPPRRSYQEDLMLIVRPRCFSKSTLQYFGPIVLHLCDGEVKSICQAGMGACDLDR